MIGAILAIDLLKFRGARIDDIQQPNGKTQKCIIIPAEQDNIVATPYHLYAQYFVSPVSPANRRFTKATHFLYPKISKEVREKRHITRYKTYICGNYYETKKDWNTPQQATPVITEADPQLKHQPVTPMCPRPSITSHPKPQQKKKDSREALLGLPF